MTKAYVIGHGGRDPAYGITWVPTNSKVVFYARFDGTLGSAIPAAILAVGDLRPAEVYNARREIPNYMFARLDDDEIAASIASVSSRLGGPLYKVGIDPLHFREQFEPMGITPPAGVMLLCTGGRQCGPTGHHPWCDGLLNRIDATEIHIIACRGTRPWSIQPATYLSERMTTSELSDTILELFADIMRTAEVDPYEAMERVETLPQATIASLNGVINFRIWVQLFHKPLSGRSTTVEVEQAWQLIRTTRPLDRNQVPEDAQRAMLRRLPPETRRILAEHSSKGTKRKRSVDPGGAFGHSSFVECWQDPAGRLEFQQWLHHRTDTPARHLAHVYREVTSLSDRTRGNEAVTQALVRLVSCLEDFTDRAGLDRRYHQEASELLAFASTTPGGERARATWRKWELPERVMFHLAVTGLLAAITKDTRDALDREYRRYRSGESSVKRPRRDEPEKESAK